MHSTIADNRSSGPLLTPVPTPGLELLYASNRTASPYPSGATIHALFAAHAAAHPAAVALRFGRQTVTYGELDRRSNRLAHCLRGLGVGPDVLVGISIDRSIEMAVALLGILKAGGGYLPLDRETPEARIRFVLQDAAAPVILTTSRGAEALPKDHGARVVCIDGEAGAIAAMPDTPVECGASARSLAYVLFTSGSTGTPKGVMVEHRAVVRLVCGTDYVTLDASDVVLQMAPLAFDASTFEIWGALLNGGSLAIMQPGVSTPADIGRAVAEYGVTTLWLTAGLFHQVVEADVEALRGVRQLLAGGDVLAVPAARKVVDQLGGTTLINGYGPTECTTFACCCRIDADALTSPTIPIGRPIANTRAYILDADGAPVEAGVQGELYIGGDGVARGYLNRADLTAERFLPDPFDDRPGARMYRTGDLARYLSDGRIEFLGRADNQVKIRGYRIELDEITSALLEHPAVSACAVIAEGDDPQARRLAAYLKVRAGAAPTATELRAFLLTRLPEYMAPGLFHQMDELPLTRNGKVDHAALAPCRATRLPSGSVYAAPRAGTEQTVAAMWQEALGIDRVGLDENFFDIGGDSLRLTKMHAKLQAATGQTFSVTVLFQFTTVRALAKYIQDNGASGETVSSSTLRTAPGGADDRAARQRAAMQRWRPAAKGGQSVG